MRLLAIICAFNEADIIPWTVRHLVRQGCDVIVLDCWSHDETVKVASDAGATVIMYKAAPVSWHGMLQRVEELAASSSADWIIHCDADEIRYSDCVQLVEVTDGFYRRHVSIGLETLASGIQRIDAAGYNAIDHTVLTFYPTPEAAAFDGSQDPEHYFRYYSSDPLNQRIGQVKAWKNVGRVDLATSGGHQVRFEGRRVYPGKFLSKHYPIRSQAHGERKVFQERAWLDQAQGRTDWHVQYKGIEPGHSFLKDPATLKEWK